MRPDAWQGHHLDDLEALKAHLPVLGHLGVTQAGLALGADRGVWFCVAARAAGLIDVK